MKLVSGVRRSREEKKNVKRVSRLSFCTISSFFIHQTKWHIHIHKKREIFSLWKKVRHTQIDRSILFMLDSEALMYDLRETMISFCCTNQCLEKALDYPKMQSKPNKFCLFSTRFLFEIVFKWVKWRFNDWNYFYLSNSSCSQRRKLWIRHSRWWIAYLIRLCIVICRWWYACRTVLVGSSCWSLIEVSHHRVARR